MNELNHAEQFFYDHAGFSFNPAIETPDQGKARCARDLARAEAYARSHDWYFEWQPDTHADPYDWDGEGEIGTEAYVCLLWDSEHRENVLASLYGIWDPDQNYMRVIEAELASEAMDADKETQARIAGYAAAGVTV